MADNITHYVFLDESGDHSLSKVDPQFPVFALAAVVVPMGYYHVVADPQLDDFKKHFWGHTNTILHGREIRKSQGDFNILQNPATRDSFNAKLNEIMRELDYKIVASVVDKNQLNDRYYYPDSPYDLTLEFIAERLYYMFRNSSNKGKLIAEARGTHLDRNLRKLYQRILTTGSGFIAGNKLRSHLDETLHFNSKAENLNGLQLADLVAYPTARKIINPDHRNRAFDIIEEKFYCSPAGCIKGYGLKTFPA